jgi:CheY-like chemotaxis protein
MLALVVEDDPGLRLIYRRILQDIGLTVIEAGDGVDALEILETQVPDLIFLDMLLPRVSGATVLNHITTEPKLSNTQTIIVSSNRQFERIVQPGTLVSFVLKPILPRQIREIALQAMEQLK